MTAKMLKQNSQRVHQTTFQGLTEDELKDPDEAKARKTFDEAIEEHLGPSAKPEDFSDDIELANPACMRMNNNKRASLQIKTIFLMTPATMRTQGQN
jgi:hypothetical protein